MTQYVLYVAALDEGDEAVEDDDSSPALDEHRETVAGGMLRGARGGGGLGRDAQGVQLDGKARPMEGQDTVWIGR